jgi:hypothetical protein
MKDSAKKRIPHATRHEISVYNWEWPLDNSYDLVVSDYYVVIIHREWEEDNSNWCMDIFPRYNMHRLDTVNLLHMDVIKEINGK